MSAHLGGRSDDLGGASGACTGDQPVLRAGRTTETLRESRRQSTHSCPSPNASMLAAPGTVYVCRSSDVHHLLNLVFEAEGVGAAVLVGT